MKRKGYCGKRRGLTAGQVGLAAAAAFLAVLIMTIHASSAWTGMSAAEQVQQALFEAEDWE